MSRRRWNTESIEQEPAQRLARPAAGQRRLFVVLPAWNEEACIRPLLLAIMHELSQESSFEPLLVVVDDGSRDRTAAEADAASAEWHRSRIRAGSPAGERMPLTVLHHEVNQGLGAALRTGITWVLRWGGDGDVLVTLDADGTHPPSLIPRLAHALSAGFDLAIASRYRRGSKIQGVPAYRRLISDLSRILLQGLFPLRGVRDYTCCFRAYRVGLLRRARALHGENLWASQGFETVMDLLLRLRPLHPRVVELPLDLHYEVRAGRSKMNVGRTIKSSLALVARRFMKTDEPSAERPESGSQPSHAIRHVR